MPSLAPSADVLAAVPLLAVLLLYAAGVRATRRRGRSWPPGRTALWLSGVLVCLAAVAGPLDHRAETDFAAHMVSHLLLGMLGPLLLVRAAPVTLALRALPTPTARRLVGVLGHPVVRVLSHPVVAAAGSLGGLFVLYTTGLQQAAERHPAVHLLVHVHVLTFGYLLSAALVGVDPDRHRAGPRCRSAVLLLAMAAHGVLAKLLYATPPTGVPADRAELGAQLMYYGGDAVDLVLVVLLCAGWYARSAPRRPTAGAVTPVG